MKQNLTVQLDAGTIKKARIIAARRSTSISRLVASEIDRLVRDDDAFERARNEALADLGRGFDLGSQGRLGRREELYGR